MKFIVSSNALLKQLQAIAGVLNSSNTIAILDNFLLKLDKGDLLISGSDLETTMSTVIQVESKNSGSVAIPAKLLLETLKSFPEQPLTFTVNEENWGIEISSDYGKYKLSGQDAREYPEAPKLESTNSTTIPAKVLAEAINKTVFATGSDDLRPVMSGVFVQLSPENLTFVATDAHKLVRYRRLDAKSDQVASFILPKKPLNLLKSTLANDDSEVEIIYNDKNAYFKFNSLQLICRLIDGRYPNYEAVIPTENPNKLTIDRVQFLGSIRRVSIFSNKTTHQVRLKITGNELQVSAEDLDFSNEAVERLNCQYQGEDMEIGFNSKFLAEMLSNLPSENVNLEMSVPNRAGILLPADSTAEGEEILMLVMPVMLNY